LTNVIIADILMLLFSINNLTGGESYESYLFKLQRGSTC